MSNILKKTAAKKMGMSVMRMNHILREIGIWNSKNEPAKAYRGRDYFYKKTGGYVHPGLGKVIHYEQVWITPKGYAFIKAQIDDYLAAKKEQLDAIRRGHPSPA